MSRPTSRTRALVAVFVAFAALTATLTPALAIEPWRLVIRLQGRVESLEPGQTAWAPVFRSRRLNDGALARTQTESEARINLADQSSFTIGPSSEVEMTKFQLTPEGRTVVFNLRFGKVRAEVAKALGRQSRFEVRTPNGVLAARGTEFSVTVMPEAELDQKQGKPSPPRAGGGSVDDLLAQTGGTVTLVQVSEGVVTFQYESGGKTHTFTLYPGEHLIMGPSGPLFNAPGFPYDSLLPSPYQRLQNPYEMQTREQANEYQDPGHREGNRTPAGDTQGSGGTPPFFNPTSTVDPVHGTDAGSTGRVQINIR